MKIIFAGTPSFAQAALVALHTTSHQIVGVFTQPDRPAGRGQKLQTSAVKQFAQQHQLPIFQPASLRHPDIQQQLRDLNADVMIVAAYGLLLPQEVLTIPRFGCINIHASLLPRWRGAAPIQRAILAGDTQTGITLMQMEVGLDTGPMLYKITCPILSTDTSQTLQDRLAHLGAEALLALLPNIEQQTLTPTLQSETQATYANKIQKTESALNWSLSAIQLDRTIRAFYPSPGTHTWLNHQLIKIHQAKIYPYTCHAIPGTITQINSEGILVATQENQLCLTHLQLAGGKILPVTELLKARSHLFTVGQCFTYDSPHP